MKKHMTPAKEFGLLTLGTALVAVGVYFFKFPNHFSFGGVTGLAVVVEPYLPISASDFSFILNMVLLAVGFAFLGKSFGMKTVYTSLLLSVLLSAFERVAPLAGPLTAQPMLELGFAIALPAVGAAILFYLGASGGGTDIVAMIFKKYTRANIGRALFFSDLIFVLGGALVFGVESFLFSFAGLMVKSLVIDNVISSMNTVKYFSVVCKDPDAICPFILEQLHRSATIVDARGAFSHEPRAIIYTAMTPAEAMRLRQHISAVDPTAFVVVSTSSEIMGRGF